MDLLCFLAGAGETSKTYAADESIDLSCRWTTYRGTIASALKQGNPKGSVFSFTDPAHLKCFHIACKRLGIKAVPYQARRSGASIDAALKYRTRLETKARGRWKADKSVLRCDSNAKIVESVDKLHGSMSAHVEMCKHRLEDLLRGRIEPSAIGPPVIQSSTRPTRRRA